MTSLFLLLHGRLINQGPRYLGYGHLPVSSTVNSVGVVQWIDKYWQLDQIF